MSLDLDENEIKGCSLRRIVQLSKQMGELVYYREFVHRCSEMVTSKIEHLVNRLEHLVMTHRVMLAPEINLVQPKKEISSALNWLHIIRRTSSELVRDLASIKQMNRLLTTLLNSGWCSLVVGNGTRKTEICCAVNELSANKNWNELNRSISMITEENCMVANGDRLDGQEMRKTKKLSTSGTLKVYCHQCDMIGLFKRI